MAKTTPRLIDIAKRADLSVTSISRILSGQRLSEYNVDMQARVRRIAQELGWRPNLVARGIKTGKTHTYGVFMAPYDTFWTGVLYGVHDTLLNAEQVPLVLWPHALVHPGAQPWQGESSSGDAATVLDYSELDGSEPESSRRELERINRLQDRRVDAIISWPLHEQSARKRLTELSAQGVPVVTVDDALPRPAKSFCVGGDNHAGMSMIREHLESLGHRRVVYVGVNRPHAWAVRRREAFFDCWPDAAASDAIDMTVDDDRCHSEILAFFDAHPKATAAIAATDHIARQIVRAIRQIGQRVPEDLSVVGHGNDVLGKGELELTTVDHRPYEIGQITARLALAPPKRRRSRQVKTPTQLLVRESTRPLTKAS